MRSCFSFFCKNRSKAEKPVELPEKIQFQKHPLLSKLLGICTDTKRLRYKLDDLCLSDEGITALKEVLAVIPERKKYNAQKRTMYRQELLNKDCQRAGNKMKCHEWDEHYRLDNMVMDLLLDEIQRALAVIEPKKHVPKV